MLEYTPRRLLPPENRRPARARSPRRRHYIASIFGLFLYRVALIIIEARNDQLQSGSFRMLDANLARPDGRWLDYLPPRYCA